MPESTEGEHPLRSDPLNTLPDAVRVPRRPRPRAAHDNSQSPRSSVHRQQPRRRVSPSPPPAHTAEQHAFEEEALALLRVHSADDPLIAAVAERARVPASPPAGHAYATDIHAALEAINDPRDEHDSPPVAAGLVDRSDVTLFPSSAEKGAAAGVYLVRSRRNWAFAAPHTPASQHGSVLSPSAEPEYYLVRRSIADFAWLEERLRYRYEGVIVPPLPPMALAGRLRHGYAYDVERLRGLERFLRRVATHAVLSTGDEVLAFLGATGEAWGKIRREPISHESSITSALFGGARDSNAIEKLGHWSEKILWQAGRKVNKGLVWFLERDTPSEARRKEDSAEARLERLHKYVQELGISLSTVRNAVHRVSHNRDQEMRGVVAMQSALHKLGEREGGSFGTHLERVRLAIASEAVASKQKTQDIHCGVPPENVDELQLTASETSSTATGAGQHTTLPAARIFDDVFRDYEESAKGAQRIMNARKEEQEAYEHALAVYTKLRDRLERRTGSMWETVPSANTVPLSGEGLEELVNNVNAASARLADVRRRYQAVALSTTDELRRLRTDMHNDLCDALHGLATEFARQHAAHSRAWASLAKALAEYRAGVGRPD